MIYKNFQDLPYKTNQAHGNHPAGSECLASRINEHTILLKYSNGDVITVFDAYCKGLETQSKNINASIIDILIEDSMREICIQEDAEVFKYLDNIK